MAENSPNLGRDSDIQVQEDHTSTNKLNLKRFSPRHITIDLPKIKDKERTLKAARVKKLITYKGTPIRLSEDFSTETLLAS